MYVLNTFIQGPNWNYSRAIGSCWCFVVVVVVVVVEIHELLVEMWTLTRYLMILRKSVRFKKGKFFSLGDTYWNIYRLNKVMLGFASKYSRECRRDAHRGKSTGQKQTKWPFLLRCVDGRPTTGTLVVWLLGLCFFFFTLEKIDSICFRSIKLVLNKLS